MTQGQPKQEAKVYIFPIGKRGEQKVHTKFSCASSHGDNYEYVPLSVARARGYVHDCKKCMGATKAKRSLKRGR